MKRNRFVLALAAVVAVCLALVGCSGSGGGGDPTKAFLGTWDLAEAPDLTSEDIDLMKALGIYCYVDLQDEGKAELNLMGEPLEGTWEAKSASECDITFEGETVTATLEDDLLSLDMTKTRPSSRKTPRVPSIGSRSPRKERMPEAPGVTMRRSSRRSISRS